MQADSPSLGEPARGSHQRPGAWAVWSCWDTAAQWVPGRLAFGRVSISFLLSIYFVCQQTPALWLYPEVCVFVNWGGPSRVLTRGIRPCPAIPRVVPKCRSRSPPLGLSSMTKAMWKAGEVGSLQLVFTPSSRQPPSVPPAPQKIQPRVFRTCGKTPWNLFVCCFHKHRLAESGFFQVLSHFLWILTASISESPHISVFPAREEGTPQWCVSCPAQPFTPTQTVQWSVS